MDISSNVEPTAWRTVRLLGIYKNIKQFEVVVGGANPIRLEPSSLVNPASIFKENIWKLYLFSVPLCSARICLIIELNLA